MSTTDNSEGRSRLWLYPVPCVGETAANEAKKTAYITVRCEWRTKTTHNNNTNNNNNNNNNNS